MPATPSRQAPWLRSLRKASPLGMLVGAGLLIYYLIIFVIPFGTAIWLSFQNYDFIDDPVYIGLSNYQRAFTDSYFWQAFKTTVVFSAVEISVGISLALGIAFLLSRVTGRLQRGFLALYYLPVTVPTVVTVLLWGFLYSPQGGVFNSLLAVVGLPPQQFINDPNQALWSVTAMIIWAYLGGGIVLFLAGINNVPQQLLEAAYLDGAGLWGVFRHVILPLLRPVLVYQVVVSVIGTVQIFTEFYLMQGPGYSTRTLAVYTYQLGFQNMDLGYGAAVSIIIFLLLIVATVVQLRRFQVTWEY
jgi:multiple sugar transport system permease protein